VSGADAAQDEALFGLRASALAALGRWEEVLQLADAPGQAPESVRLMIKSGATRELGRPGEADELVRAALRASVADQRITQTIEMADLQGLRPLADEAVVDLCANAAEADRAFALARDRFSRRGQFSTLGEAYAAARQASPEAPSVQVYERYREILDGKSVDLTVTAEAVAVRPTDVNARFNHALALLQAGQAKEALAVFDGFDVLTPQLPPGLQAVCAALLHAAGDQSALTLAGSINPDLLWPGEYALIAPLLQAGR
jgi:tetratricopeptide (TPR) repeat protein